MRCYIGLYIFLLSCCFSGAGGCASYYAANSKPDPQYPIKTVLIRDFNRVKTTQSEVNWCWAACAFMVRKYDGDPRMQSIDPRLGQQTIVERVQGKEANGSAERLEVLAAFDPDAFELYHQSETEEISALITALFVHHEKNEQIPPELKKAEPKEPSLGINYLQLLDGLRARRPRPAIAAIHDEFDRQYGHVVVIIGADYQEIPLPPGVTSNGLHYSTRVLRMTYYDPYDDPKHNEPAGEHIVEAGSIERRCDFLVTETAAKAYLKYLVDRAQWITKVANLRPKPKPEPRKTRIQTH